MCLLVIDRFNELTIRPVPLIAAVFCLYEAIPDSGSWCASVVMPVCISVYKCVRVGSEADKLLITDCHVLINTYVG